MWLRCVGRYVVDVTDARHAMFAAAKIEFRDCGDPEGHIWNVGTYDPWASEA